uniref:Lipid droplet-associated hydrolase n=1 Tax=Ciona savignyi TaxID=51511 RepID=H2Z651_CIOSA
GIAVKYLKCGESSTSGKIPLVFFVIPGNPGCIRFYEKFADSLFSKTKIPVWGISHVGHSKLPSVDLTEKDKYQHPGREDCGLSRQIALKVDFLRDEVFPVAEKVILVGHSIGCYIILQIMSKLDGKLAEKVEKGVLLFPTIERMRLTPQGKKLTPMLANARWLFWAVEYLIHKTDVPVAIESYKPDLFSSEPSIIETVADNIASHQVADSMTYMGLQEMYEVGLRCRKDDDLVSKFLSRLIFYYGASDKWCPYDFYEKMKLEFGSRPGAHIEVADQGIPHAFVLTHSHQVAEKVAGW